MTPELRDHLMCTIDDAIERAKLTKDKTYAALLKPLD